MGQPKWQEYMAYELQVLSDGNEKNRNKIIDETADLMQLSDELKEVEISSGTPMYVNRAGWGLTYLKQSGLIASPKRGSFVITSLGKDLMKTNPKVITTEDLEKYPGYKAFIKRTKANNNHVSEEEKEDNALSPDDMIFRAEKQYKEIACNELLELTQNMNYNLFEKLVVELLLAMGYGDKNEKNSGFAVGKKGDGGIDGIIKQDKLGINKIYIQAKRYKATNKVSPHDVRDFVGALMTSEGGHSRTGVFITTSDFTKEGIEYVEKLDKGLKVILINGKELVEYMYQYGIGVTPYRSIVLNKVDRDYFDEE